jgi:hypothetical protein
MCVTHLPVSSHVLAALLQLFRKETAVTALHCLLLVCRKVNVFTGVAGQLAGTVSKKQPQSIKKRR